MQADKQLMTRSEAAEALAISPRKLDMLAASGDLPSVRIGRSVRFRPSALEFFVEARESRMNPRKKKGGKAR
jgi:excisionase family DNA binding protein